MSRSCNFACQVCDDGKTIQFPKRHIARKHEYNVKAGLWNPKNSWHKNDFVSIIEEDMYKIVFLQKKKLKQCHKHSGKSLSMKW